MAEQQQSTYYESFLKAVSFCLRQFRLYSANHPITQDSLKALALELEKYFSTHPKITLGALRHRLIVDGQPAGEKDMAAAELAKDLERLEINGLSFSKGLEIEEMTKFVELMSMRPKALESKGGFQKAFEIIGFKNIRLSTGKFALVEDGQDIIGGEGVAKEQAGRAEEEPKKEEASKAGTITSIADVISRLRMEQSGDAAPPKPADVDSEKLVTQIEKSPQEMAELTIQDLQDPSQLEQVIRKIVKFLIDSLLSYLVEQGKDITKTLDRFSRELQKALKRLGNEEDFKDIEEKIPQIFEEGTDELRIQMMVRTFKENPDNIKKLKSMANKLLKEKEVRDRLGPSVQEELINAGLDKEQITALFVELEKKAEKKKRKVSIDPEELAELRYKAQNFDKELSKRLDTAVDKLEKEKKKLKDEKERVDTVIRNLAEGLLVVDKDGKVVLMNPAAEKLLGIKQNDKVGKSVSDGLSEEHAVAMTQGNLRDPNETAKNVETFSVDDETKKILQASTAVIENEDGQTVGMVSVLSDVTREKELSEMKSKFVANVSHELRTPLVAIQKSLGLILSQEVGKINDEQSRFLNIATRNIERLSRLINDLLDVSKLEAGKLNLKPKQIPVKELVSHVISTVETWAKDKNVSVEADIQDEGLELEADPDRITQVLTNLMGNAMKFSPDGGKITIDVRTNVKDPELGNDELVEIGVRDTGCGISAEDQKKIFEKFVQVGDGQPAGVASTGLGLTIVKEIVTLHSGRIWVDSEEGKGSRFAFRIPRRFRLNEPAATAS